MRQHEVIWTCDRCGLIERVGSKSDNHFPDGWGRLEYFGITDVCGNCMGDWKTRFSAYWEKFLLELVPEYPGDREPRTIIDAELSELDPEVSGPDE